MKLSRLALAIPLFCLGLAGQLHAAVDYTKYTGWCEQGGQTTQTNGIQSSPQFPIQRSYPQCNVTVYVHGSNLSVKASVYSDDAGTVPLANPFAASTTGLIGFYVAVGRYDIQLSGGNIPSPITLFDQYLEAGGGGSGGGGCGITSPCLISQGGTSATTATQATVNLQFLEPYTDAVARSDAAKFGDQVSVLDFAADNTGTTDARAAVQAAINVAAQRASTAHGVSVFFPCGTYTVSSPGLEINALNVSLIGENTACTRLAYTGTTGGLLRNYNYAGTISDINIILPNAPDLSVYGIWTNSQQFTYRNLITSTCENATAYLINNANVVAQPDPNNVDYIQGNVWSNVSTQGCKIGFHINQSSAYGTPPAYQYMGYNQFENIGTTIHTGQIGMLVDQGPLFRESVINQHCFESNAGSGGDMYCLQINNGAVWDRNTYRLDGEYNPVGGATGNAYTVQVNNGGTFKNVDGYVDVRQLTAAGVFGSQVPFQNNLAASALPSVTLRQQDQPSWDNGTFNMASGVPSTPWSAFRDDTIGQLGIMNAATIHSPFAQMSSAANNRFLFLVNNGSQTVGGSTEIGSVDNTGRSTWNGGVRLNTTTGIPTCAATVRGLYWDAQGGAGVADNNQVCIKTSADTYGWSGILNSLTPGVLANKYFATGAGAFTPVNGTNENIAIGEAGYVVMSSGPSTAFTIGGFANGIDGRELVLTNNTGQALTIANADAGSVPANRIFTGTGANVITTNSPTLLFKYSSTLGMWTLASGAANAGSSIISSPGQIIYNLAGTVQGVNTIPSSQTTFQQVSSATTGTVQNELAQRVTPQQFGAVANGVNDDSGAINAAITYLSSLPTTYTKKLSFFGNYFLNTSNYQISLPYDAGDYSNTFTGSGAAVSFTVVGGGLTSCSVSGGSAYTFSSTLQVEVFDPTRSGTGGHATVSTDAAGVPFACSIVTAGLNYASSGVQGTVIPVGGDGATATAALVSGSLTTGAATVLTAGSGYTSTITILTGLVCTTYPTFSSTVSSTGIATVTVVTGGGTCTLGGNANATVPLIFGDSCGGSQCSNIAPETPQLLGCAVAIRSGISYEGEGKATLLSNWTLNGSVVDLNQTVPMCDPWGDQSSNLTIKNLSFNGMVGLWFTGALTSSILDNLSFNGGVGLYASFTGGTGQGNNFASTSNNLTNITLNGSGGLVFGGTWVRRNGMTSSGSGSLGGIDVHNGGTTNDGGTSSGNIVRNLSANSGLSINAALDVFFEQYVWKFQNGPATLRYGINGQSVCYGTLSVVDRTTDFYASTANNTFATTYPWSNCYYGVTGTEYVASNRWNSGNYQNSFDNIHSSFSPIHRPIIYGNWVGSLFNNIVASASTGAVWADPYTNSAAEPGFISIVNGPTGSGGSNFSNITTSITAPFTTLVNHSSRSNTDQSTLDTYLGGMTAIGSSPSTKFPGTLQFGSGIGAGTKMIVSSSLPSGACSNGSIYLYTGGTGGLYVCQSTAWVGPK